MHSARALSAALKCQSKIKALAFGGGRGSKREGDLCFTALYCPMLDP